MMKAPINVAIRGAGGLLGHRIFRTILKTQPDIRVGSVVLGKDEPSFRRFESVYRFSSQDIPVFIDAKRKHVEALIDQWRPDFELKSLSAGLDVLKQSDAVLDAAIVSGGDHLSDFYRSYQRKKPIIFQSGTYPQHQPIAPPFQPPSCDTFDYRQGDCLVSGIAPLIHIFRDSIDRIGLTLLVQRQTRLNDYTLRDHIDDIIMNPNLESRVHAEVCTLLPSVDPAVVSTTVFEAPGHDYYMCVFKIVLSKPMDRDEILASLRSQPRVFVAPETLSISTGQLQQKIREQRMENGIPLQPIVCFSTPGGVEINGTHLTLRAAFYSKAITVLPNIDAIRGLVKRTDFRSSMKATDEYYGFED